MLNTVSYAFEAIASGDGGTNGLMANQPLARQEDPPLGPEPLLGKQSMSGLSASNNSNLLAGQFGDVYIGESKSEPHFTNSCTEAVGSLQAS